jgi:hypothetical protein
MELRKELSYFLQSLDGDDLRNLADGNTTEERLIDEYLDNKAEAKQRAAHHQMLEGATVCSKTEPTKPTDEKPTTAEKIEEKLLSLFGFTEDGCRLVDVEKQCKIFEFMDWYASLKPTVEVSDEEIEYYLLDSPDSNGRVN